MLLSEKLLDIKGDMKTYSYDIVHVIIFYIKSRINETLDWFKKQMADDPKFLQNKVRQYFKGERIKRDYRNPKKSVLTLLGSNFRLSICLGTIPTFPVVFLFLHAF